MKHLCIVVIILTGLASVAWSQIPGGGRRFGKVAVGRHAQSNMVGKRAAIARSAHSAAQPIVAKDLKVWQLGTYPGGNWSWINNINDLGIAVGWSNLSGPDLQHPVMVPVFGPHAQQWFDLAP